MITYNPALKIFTPSLINDTDYFSGFSTKDLGDSKNPKNISNFLNLSLVEFKKIILLDQIHSLNIHLLEKDIPGVETETIEDTDGVITNLGQTVLVVRTADCLPLIIVDKTTGFIGISHQGWRGSLKNMAGKMVKTLQNSGSKLHNLICVLGPGIGACCYDVDQDRYFSFLQEYDGYSQKIFSRRGNRWHLNLALLNYLQLLNAGVKTEKVDFFPFCSKCDKKRFFSRRRNKKTGQELMFNFVMKSR